MGRSSIPTFSIFQLRSNSFTRRLNTPLKWIDPTLRQACRLVLHVKGKGLVLNIKGKRLRLSCEHFLWESTKILKIIDKKSEELFLLMGFQGWIATFSSFPHLPIRHYHRRLSSAEQAVLATSFVMLPRPRGEKHVRLGVKLLQLLDETQDHPTEKLHNWVGARATHSIHGSQVRDLIKVSTWFLGWSSKLIRSKPAGEICTRLWEQWRKVWALTMSFDPVLS